MLSSQIINICKAIIIFKAWKVTPGRVFLIRLAIGENMNSKTVSLFICAVMVTSIFGVIPHNVGEPSSGLNGNEEIVVSIPHNVGESRPTSGGSGGLANSPWPMFRQNLNHTGLSPYDTSTNPGKLKWSFETGGDVQSSPAIGSDGTIYMGSHDNKLYAINPDGTEKWNYTTNNRVRSSPAIGSDGTIYVGSYDNRLYAINPDGTEKWNFSTGLYISWSSPTIGSDGTIYVGSDDSKLYAINPDGTEKWNFTTGGMVNSSPAIGSDGTIYVGSWDSKLYAINPDGTLKWSFMTGHFVWSSPAVVSDGTLYIGSSNMKLFAINPDGTEKWSFMTGGAVDSSPAIGSDGTIYVGSDDDILYAINPDGSQEWNFSTNGQVQSSPAIGSDSTIYVGSRDTKLYAINPDGTEKWNFTTGSLVHSSPAIDSDGTIYVGSNDHNLYAIGTSDQPPTANAGPNQTVDEGNPVQFDGSNSTGSEGHFVKDPSVVALWHMNEGSGNVIYDETDNHHDGTIIDATWTTDGKFGNALSFDGVDDYVEIKPSDQIFGDNPDEWSYFVWFRTSNDNENLCLISDTTQDQTSAISLTIVHLNSTRDINVISTLYHIGPGYKARFGIKHKDNFTNDNWYFIAVTVSKIENEHKLFINGEKMSQGLLPFIQKDYFEGIDLRIGARNPLYFSDMIHPYVTPFDGILDEIVLFNRTLTESEIQDYFNNSREYLRSGSASITSYEWDFESDGIYDHKETAYNAPDGTFDGMTTHTYGDNGEYMVTLRITDETNATDTDSCNITVNNVDPIIEPITSLTVDENSPITITASATDQGSDDLTFTWDWGFGTPVVSNTFYNDGIGPDPFPSPDGIFPFSAADTQSHTYGDNGVFPVTLTVEDDDGGSSVYIVNVTVRNIDPTAAIESVSMEVEIGLRVAGRKYNDVSMTLYEEGSSIGSVSIERLPGSPNEQMAWIPVTIDFSKSYSANVTFTPEDPPNVGANPVWIYIKSQNGTINQIHHTFNVQQSKKRNSDHWNHVEPWEVDLNGHFIGLPFIVTSHIIDPGSDDETLICSYGSQVKTVTYLSNPPNQDPYPSPEVDPVDIMDTMTLVYEGPGIVTLVVKDDDNIRLGVGEGTDSKSVG